MTHETPAQRRTIYKTTETEEQLLEIMKFISSAIRKSIDKNRVIDDKDWQMFLDMKRKMDLVILPRRGIWRD